MEKQLKNNELTPCVYYLTDDAKQQFADCIDILMDRMKRSWKSPSMASVNKVLNLKAQNYLGCKKK